MTLTHDIYRDLYDSLKKGKYQMLSKSYTTPNGLSLIYALSTDGEKRALYYRTDENVAESMPKCKGISIGKVHLYEYSPDDFYCEIRQNNDGEGYIFEIIVEDIRKNVDGLKYEQKIGNLIAERLLKWKTFFTQEKSVVMNTERQQGLYGELLCLQQLIDIHGPAAVNFWTGCGYETHDFYVKGNAVEVKTTSNKAPYKLHISSEYQLDDKEITGELFVDFYALRKSSADGETLPDIISDIRKRIAENPMLTQKFDVSLEDYGYYDGLEDKYQTGYHIREEHFFVVRPSFPRIIKGSLPKGISGCTYDVLINECGQYEVGKEDKVLKLKGERIG